LLGGRSRLVIGGGGRLLGGRSRLVIGGGAPLIGDLRAGVYGRKYSDDAKQQRTRYATEPHGSPP
jgi:hypothetical protein